MLTKNNKTNKKGLKELKLVYGFVLGLAKEKKKKENIINKTKKITCAILIKYNFNLKS